MWSPSEENALKELKNLLKPKFRIMQKKEIFQILLGLQSYRLL